MIDNLLIGGLILVIMFFTWVIHELHKSHNELKTSLGVIFKGHHYIKETTEINEMTHSEIAKYSMAIFNKCYKQH